MRLSPFSTPMLWKIFIKAIATLIVSSFLSNVVGALPVIPLAKSNTLKYIGLISLDLPLTAVNFPIVSRLTFPKKTFLLSLL